MRLAEPRLSASIITSCSMMRSFTGAACVWITNASVPRTLSPNREYTSPLAKSRRSTEPHSMPRCRATSPESSWLARPENSMRCLRPRVSTILGVTPLLTARLPGSAPVGSIVVASVICAAAPPAPGRPTLDDALDGALDGQRTGRNVLGDGRAGRCLRPITDGEGRNQHGIRSDEGAVTHDGAVLVLAVVVDEHRAGADVDVLADLGVADVGEVRHLAAAPDARLLDLHVGADLAAGTQLGPRTQIGERADHRARADVRLDGDRLRHGGLVVHRAGDQAGVGADRAAGADASARLQERQRFQHGVLADLDAGVHVGG